MLKGFKRFFINKLLWYLLTLFIAILFNFLLPRLIPGNPVSAIVAKLTHGMNDLDQIKEVYLQYEKQFGLDKPIWMQFLLYIKNLVHGDFGISMSQYPASVTSILADSLPWTIALQLPAIVVSWIVGNVLGALAAYIRGVYDKVIFPVFVFFSCVPAFALSIIFVWLFAITLQVAPASGGYGFDQIPNFSFQFIVSVLAHYQLPFWSIVLVSIGSWSMGMREMSIYELNADYVKFSRLLGIRNSRISGYVFKNAMLPQVTGIALSLGSMVGGALITEIVFSYPGIGTTMFNAISSQDYPLISGCTLVITLTVLAANFIVDILYGFIDPRINISQQEEY